jgi:hypothetical protein
VARSAGVTGYSVDGSDKRSYDTILNIARIGPNTIFWIFGKGFFLIAPVGLLLEHRQKNLSEILKKLEFSNALRI